MLYHGRNRRVRTVTIRSSNGSTVHQWQSNLFCTVELEEKDGKVVKVLCRDLLWTTEYILGNNDSVEIRY